MSSSTATRSRIAEIIEREFNVACEARKGEYHWQAHTEMRPEARVALGARIEARISLLKTMQLAIRHLHANIPLDVAARAPLAPTIFGWIGLGYSTQHLRRLLDTRLTSAYLYIDLAIDQQIRDNNQANADLIEKLLDVLDAKETVAA